MLNIDVAQDQADEFSQNLTVALQNYCFDPADSQDLTTLLRTVKDAHDFGSLLPILVAVTLELADANDDWRDFTIPETLTEFFSNPYLGVMFDCAERLNASDYIEHEFSSDLTDFIRCQFEKCYAD